jgi:hypothetical protein
LDDAFAEVVDDEDDIDDVGLANPITFTTSSWEVEDGGVNVAAAADNDSVRSKISRALLFGSGIQLKLLVMSLSLVGDADDDDVGDDVFSSDRECISMIFEFCNILLTIRGIIVIIICFDDGEDDETNNGGTLWFMFVESVVALSKLV